jgi:DNA-binding FadR family transcriptional regulator
MLDVRRKTGTVVQPPENWQLFDPDIVSWRAQAATLDGRFVADLMELRRVVEPQAARFAAERITEDEIDVMRKAFDGMAAAVAGEGEYVPADLAFHGVILAACHNQFLRQMQDVLSVILRTSFTLSSRVPGGPAASLPLHEALCKAIETRDVDGAERAVMALIERAERDLRAVISAQPSQRPANDK